MFQQEVIPDRYRQVPIHQIKPDINLKELGVDVFQATPEGIAAVYQHGWDKGREFLTAESGQPQRADPRADARRKGMLPKTSPASERVPWATQRLEPHVRRQGRSSFSRQGTADVNRIAIGDSINEPAK